MKNKYFLTCLCLLFLTTVVAQVTKEQALVALEQVLNSEQNKLFKKQVLEDLQLATAQPTYTTEDKKNLQYAYSKLARIYNRIYLAEIKLSLTNYKQLKKLGKNPEKQAKKYQDNMQLVLDNYEQQFLPAIEQVMKKEVMAISGDIDPAVRDSLELEQMKLFNKSSRVQNLVSTIGVASSVFFLVEGLSRLASQRRQEKQMVIREFSMEAGALFSNAMMQEWGQLDVQSGQNGPSEKEMSIPAEAAPPMNEEMPPTDLAFLDQINGEIFFEVYDETAREDMFMEIEQGTGSLVTVNDYGTPSFDLVLGSKKKSRSRSSKKNTTVSPYVTTNAYGNGTLYRVRSFGSGYVYVLSINSGNRLFSIFPNQGNTKEVEPGTNYNYPDNAYFDDDSGMVSVSIPDGEFYIEIVDAPGAPIPEQETMIVLVSRSQLDIKDVMQQMESMGTAASPQERLASIFGSLSASPAQGKVNIDGGRLMYALSDDMPAVLPFVFGIRRQ